MFPLTSVLLMLPLVVLCLYTLHKVRQIHLMLFALKGQAQAQPAELFRQLEALQGLYTELGLAHSLPPTRGWAASPDFLLAVARHTRHARPHAVVECSSGTSTLVLARCLQLNGHGKVYSLEHDAHYAEQTRQQLRQHGLSDWAEVLQAPLLGHNIGADTWPWYVAELLPAALKIDLLVIDGPPMATRALARYPAGPLLFHRLVSGAHVFLDDAARPDEQAILVRWKNEFPQLAHSTVQCEKGCAVLVRD